MSPTPPDEAWRRVQDPSTGAAELADLALRRPDLLPWIVAHPRHDPTLSASRPTAPPPVDRPPQPGTPDAQPGAVRRRVLASVACACIAAAVVVIGALLSGPLAEDTPDEVSATVLKTATPEPTPSAETPGEFTAATPEDEFFGVLPSAENFDDSVSSLTPGTNYWDADETPRVAVAAEVEEVVVAQARENLGNPPSYDAWLDQVPDAACEEFADRIFYFEDFGAIVDEGRLRARLRTVELDGQTRSGGYFGIEAMAFADASAAEDFVDQARTAHEACTGTVDVNGVPGRYLTKELGFVPVDHLAYDTRFSVPDDFWDDDSWRLTSTPEAPQPATRAASLRADGVTQLYGAAAMLVRGDTVVVMNVIEATAGETDHIIGVAADALSMSRWPGRSGP